MYLRGVAVTIVIWHVLFSVQVKEAKNFAMCAPRKRDEELDK